MKKWHLHEHVLDIFDWRDDAWLVPYPPSVEETQQLRFIAYERWLNDRELLTIEDGYEWKNARRIDDRDRSPSPNRPTHTTFYTTVSVDILEKTEAELKNTGMPGPEGDAARERLSKARETA